MHLVGGKRHCFAVQILSEEHSLKREAKTQKYYRSPHSLLGKGKTEAQKPLQTKDTESHGFEEAPCPVFAQTKLGCNTNQMFWPKVQKCSPKSMQKGA